MSHETRRRVILICVALIVVALVLGSVGCSSTSGNGDDADALSPALYIQAMGDICDATTERLDALPTPPDEISRADWAGEVSRALRDEAAAFDEIDVGDDRRTDHASFVENTEGQAAGWMALGEALAEAEPDSADDQRPHDRDHRADARSQRPRRRDGARRLPGSRAVVSDHDRTRSARSTTNLGAS